MGATISTYSRLERGRSGIRSGLTVAPLAIAAVLLANGAQAQSWPSWEMVVNNGTLAPTSTPQTSTPYFFSYNQPSINDSGLVVFRARAKPLSSGGGSEGEGGAGGEGGSGGGGGVTQGIYTRDMSLPGSPINVLADNKGVTVPSPNTTGATFNEFPSVPRVDATSSTVVFRGGSQPVYTLPDGTKSGTSGVYMNRGGSLITAASQLGDAGLTQYSVPNAPAGTGFDQFPGAPAVTGGSTVVFKGNYTVNAVAETGVFYRNTSLGPTAPVESIAQYGQPIPGFPGAVFGSTAPPSAAAGKVVFTGWNNEAAPTAGGIYLAPLSPNPTLTTLAKIGEAVPKTGGQTFSNFGEGLSFNGANVGFWASWGTATMTVHKTCAAEGMAASYCLSKYPNGVDLTEPLHQGIFDLNTTTDALTMIAQTGVNGYTDFLNWTFSGRVPGSENENDGELARWRSSAYLSDSSGNVVFLGQKGSLDGLYLGAGNSIDTLLTTDSLGQSVDPMAPAGSLVSSIGLERDGFVGDRLGVSVGMLDPATAESWGGIYLTPRVPEEVLAALRLSTPVPEPSTWAMLLSGFAGLGYLAWRGEKRQAAAS